MILNKLEMMEHTLEAMEQQMTAEREKRAAILRSEGERESQVNEARGRAESLVLDAKARKEASWRWRDLLANMDSDPSETPPANKPDDKRNRGGRDT